MDPRVRGHVLAHVVDADIHQLDRVERAAAEMRGGGRMRGAAAERIVDARARKALASSTRFIAPGAR